MRATPYDSRMRGTAALALLPLLLAGCGGSVSLWPFGGGGTATAASRKPANATEYRCDGGKVFFVRPLEKGEVWLIAPDREILLAKLEGGGERYGVGRVVLEISGQGAQLTDPPAVFAGCKRADAAK